MTTLQSIATILIVVCGTFATRCLPFLLFPENKTPPSCIQYLGTVLPPAMIGLLVVYCLKDSVRGDLRDLPAFTAILFILLLHRWKKNSLLSIGAGTFVYMLLVQA